MTATKIAYVVAGVLVGFALATTVGSVQAERSRASQQTSATSATVTLSGAKGRYLHFTGRQRQAGVFKGSLAFKRPVTNGRYALGLTLKTAGQSKVRLTYDVDVRQR